MLGALPQRGLGVMKEERFSQLFSWESRPFYALSHRQAPPLTAKSDAFQLEVSHTVRKKKKAIKILVKIERGWHRLDRQPSREDSAQQTPTATKPVGALWNILLRAMMRDTCCDRSYALACSPRLLHIVIGCKLAHCGVRPGEVGACLWEAGERP
jgi:hypothetical protein